MRSEFEIEEARATLGDLAKRSRDNQDAEELDKMQFAYGLLSWVLYVPCPAGAKVGKVLKRWRQDLERFQRGG